MMYRLDADTDICAVEQLSDEKSKDNDELERLRRQNGKELLIAHLHISSIQKKFEDLTDIIKAIYALLCL